MVAQNQSQQLKTQDDTVSSKMSKKINRDTSRSSILTPASQTTAMESQKIKSSKAPAPQKELSI